jgi:hypothetical protein
MNIRKKHTNSHLISNTKIKMHDQTECIMREKISGSD